MWQQKGGKKTNKQAQSPIEGWTDQGVKSGEWAAWSGTHRPSMRAAVCGDGRTAL